MLAEGVHRFFLCGQIPGTYRGECLCDIETPARDIKAEEASPSWKQPWPTRSAIALEKTKTPSLAAP